MSSYAERLIEGRQRAKAVYETPDELLNAAAKYFEWCEATPLLEEQASHYQGTVIRYDVNKARAFTKTGLANYLGITTHQLNAYKTRADEEWAEVAELIEQVIYAQKFEHAAAGLLNANIISRDLGLADKSELSGPGGEPLQTVVQYQLPNNNRDSAAPEAGDE